MLDKLAKEPYVAPGRRVLQFGIWILVLSFNREKEKHMKMSTIVSTQYQTSKVHKEKFKA